MRRWVCRSTCQGGTPPASAHGTHAPKPGCQPHACHVVLVRLFDGLMRLFGGASWSWRTTGWLAASQASQQAGPTWPPPPLLACPPPTPPHTRARAPLLQHPRMHGMRACTSVPQRSRQRRLPARLPVRACRLHAAQEEEVEHLKDVLRELSATRGEAIRLKVQMAESYTALQDEYYRRVLCSAHEASPCSRGPGGGVRGFQQWIWVAGCGRGLGRSWPMRLRRVDVWHHPLAGQPPSTLAAGSSPVPILPPPFPPGCRLHYTTKPSGCCALRTWHTRLRGRAWASQQPRARRCWTRRWVGWGQARPCVHQPALQATRGGGGTTSPLEHCNGPRRPVRPCMVGPPTCARPQRTPAPFVGCACLRRRCGHTD